MTFEDHQPPRPVDAENPWPGLAAFTADNRAFFKGRDAECRELIQRVRNDGNITVLYGLSGLGKTSLIQAGLTPALERDAFLPVVMRIDHEIRGEGVALMTQLQEALLKAMPQPPLPAVLAERTFWRLMHRRDLLLADAKGRKLLPIIILDQFEEIFSLGAATPENTRRSDAFFRDLCDLALGRVPPDVAQEREQLQARIEQCEIKWAEPNANRPALERERADLEEQFNRLSLREHRYEILLSLREDYYPHLETKARRIQASGLVDNRMRLLPLDGVRALEAVQGPGGRLLEDGTAVEIVLSVGRVGWLQPASLRAGESGGDIDMESVQVEPAFLSLMCEQLNEDRKGREAQLVKEGKLGADERPLKITSAMVREKRDVVLENYYDRCLKELPQISNPRQRDRLASFIETKLLSDFGQFRLQVPVEDACRQLESAGVNPKVLETLVHKHRLLRIEHRGVPRIELTHDVLTGVVAGRRAVRKARARLLQRVKHAIMGVAAAILLVFLVLAVIAFHDAERESTLRMFAEQETRRANDATAEVKRLGDKSVSDMRQFLGGWYQKEVQRAIDEARILDADVILAKAAETADMGPLPLLSMLAPAPVLRALRHYTMAAAWREVQFSPDGRWIAALDFTRRLLLVPREFAGRDGAFYLASRDGDPQWKPLPESNAKATDAASVRAYSWQPNSSGKAPLAVGTVGGVWLMATPEVGNESPQAGHRSRK